MLRVHQVAKSYGLDPLFHSVTFTVLPGERVGLVGPNGCGKTTLLRILSGDEKPDSGSVQFFPTDLRLGTMAQGLVFDPQDTLERYIAKQEGDIAIVAEHLEELAIGLVNQPGSRSLQQAYDLVLGRLERISESSGYTSAVLDALGLGVLPPDMPLAAFSGGQKTRLALAGVLLSKPQLLLLDEPTNHLDLNMLYWLEEWLLNYSGSALIVSHDRAFLDQIATSILEIDPLGFTTRRYEGNYTAFLEQKLAERERHWQEYHDQQGEIARLQGAAAQVRSLSRFRKGGKTDTGDKLARGFFANRGLETMRRAKQIERRIDQLVHKDHIDKPVRTWQMKMEFNEIPASGRLVVSIQNLTAGYGDQVLLDGIDLTVRYGQRIAVVGSNGAGKTTLLRTIAGTIPALDGQVQYGANVQAGFMTQEHEHLNPRKTVLETMHEILAKTETEVRAFLSLYLFSGDTVFTPTGLLSYGERARLSLACLVAQGCNLLLLDEPVNHLDIPSRARFEQALQSYEGTCIAVVHDRYFIEGYASEIWEIRGGKIQVNPLVA